MSSERPSQTTGRLTGDRGQVGGIEVLPFGLLVLVIGTLLIANAWAVLDASLAVDAAAREGLRTLVESSDEPTGRNRASLAAREALAGHGRESHATVVVHTPFGHRRCAAVAVEVSLRVPRPALPLIGSPGGDVEVSRTHTGLVDPHRSGLTGEASC